MSYMFYEKYLNKKFDEVKFDEINTTNNQINIKDSISDNNLIKNLKYEIMLDDNSKYSINSELSEISYVNGFENVKMKNVNGMISDKKKNLTTISSDFANYESLTHNTVFRKNIKIKYLNDIIQSDKVFLNFIDQTIIIEDNIKYKNNLSYLSADIVKINLKTKKIEIMMRDEKNKIQVYMKK